MNFIKSHVIIRKIEILLKKMGDFIYELALETFEQMLGKLKIIIKDFIQYEDSMKPSKVEELVRLHRKNKYKSRQVYYLYSI